MNPPSHNVVSCEIHLGESVLDAYLLPNGEKRLGIENIVVALGYKSTKVFFPRTKLESATLKELKRQGFSGKHLILASRTLNEGVDTRTLGLRDFVKLVTYKAVSQRNTKAIILLASFAEKGIEQILDDAFAGKSLDFLLEKIIHYSKWTYEELEEVLAYNREEVRALYYLPNRSE